ncbi:MAG: adenylate cyclase [Acidimicrobiaceae bacterium]
MDTAQLAAIAGSSRVIRSFAFIDLCGFTDFVDARGDEAAVTEVQHLRVAVREVAPLFGVRVEKWLGDGVMIVGVDNEPLVAAVVAIEQRFRHHGELAVRAGIATGPVLLVDGDDYIGRAVNVASRLCDSAGAGELLAATDGLALPVWVDVEREVTVELKGLHEPTRAVVLVASPGAVEPHKGWSVQPLGSLVALGRRASRRAG